MGCRILIANVLMLVLSLGSSAQGILSNGGFEDHSVHPWAAGDFCLANGWTNCAGLGTPDYLHLNGIGLPQLPACFAATVSPHSGKAVMGMALRILDDPGFREYLSHKLSVPLMVGVEYSVSFYVSNGVNNGIYGGLACDQMSVALTEDSLKQIIGAVIPNMTPQFVHGQLLYSTGWQQLSFNMVADSAYEWITFGNFVNDAGTGVQLMDSAQHSMAYYFLDDVEITAMTAGVNDPDPSVKIELYPNPVQGRLTVKLHGNNWQHIVLEDCAAREVMRLIPNGEYSTMDLSKLSSGIYYLRVSDSSMRSIVKRVMVQ